MRLGSTLGLLLFEGEEVFDDDRCVFLIILAIGGNEGWEDAEDLELDGNEGWEDAE
jgi:hypothetical protein